MKTPVTHHEPFGVYPDVAPEKQTTDMAKSATNIRMNPAPPDGGQSRTRVLPNEEVPNPLLPDTGVNWNVGPQKNNTTGQQYAFNYNSLGLHAIYRFSEPDTWEVIIEDPLLNFKQRQDPLADDYVKDYVVNSLYHPSGLLLWQDGINEDRVINVERGIRTYAGELTDVYQLPIQDWVLAQLHLPPKMGLQIYGVNGDANSTFDYISNTVPKPLADVPLRSFQFGANWGFMDDIESRICEPSIVNWNNQAYIIVPDQVFYNFMGNGNYETSTPPTAPNPYIKYMKFYYREGNTNDWILFKKIDNTLDNWLNIPTDNPQTVPPIATGYQFGFILPDLQSLTPIGGVSAAALALVDGVPLTSKGTTYGDSRLLKWSTKSGRTLALPTATITPESETTITADSKARSFPPIRCKLDFGLRSEDNRGRVIGSNFIGTETLAVPASYDVDIQDIRTADPGFDFENATWEEVVDFLPDPPGGVLRSMHDVYRLRYDFTPSGTLADGIEMVRLISRNHYQFSQFLRTQSRPYFIFKGGNEGSLVAFLDTGQGYNVTVDGIAYSFYGIGFEMGSAPPINFSTEQNYYITVRGYVHSILTTDLTGRVPIQLLDSGTEYKVTDQLGSILVCKLPSPNILDQRTSFSVLNYSDQGTPGPWIHCLADIVLYSKVPSPTNLYNVDTAVVWTRDEWNDGLVRSYYGDSFLTTDQKSYFAASRQVFSGIPTGGDINLILYNLAKIDWTGTFGCTAMTGIYVEFWDSDIGSGGELQSEPQEVFLEQGMIHGEQYLLGSKINNMFVFNPLNRSQVTGDIGALISVQIVAFGSGTGDNIYCICTAGSEVRFLAKIQQTASNGEQVMSLSTNVFGNENTQPWRIGVQSQMEVVNTGEGQVFHFDRVKKVLMQITLGGQDPISMQQFQVSDMATFDGPGAMGYDPLYREIVYACQAGGGFAYNFQTKKYQGFRTYGVSNITEGFSFGASEGIGKLMYGYSKGKLFRFNAATNPQLINGEPYSTEIIIISNPGVPLLKNYASVRYYSLAGKVWKAFIRNPAGRESHIPKDEFDEYATYFKGSIMCDVNSDGGQEDGDIINGAWAEVTISDDTSTPKDLTFIEVGFTPSLQQ